MSRTIDIEELISLVESHPVIWNKKISTYKDRGLTKDAWIEVCKDIHGDFDNMDNEEQNIFIKEVMKKWWNIRDGYMKSIKKREELIRSGANVTKLKKYIYHKRLWFLNFLLNNEPVPEEGMFLEGEPESKQTEFCKVNTLEWTSDQDSIDNKPNFSCKRRKTSSIDEELLEGTREEETNDRHLSFFNGIIPSLKSFEEDEIIEFQMGVLQLISKIRKQKKGNTSHISSTNSP